MRSMLWFSAKRVEVAALFLRCVREQLNDSPALEIPEWMFDSSLCSQMKQDNLAYVSSAALLALKDLLSAAPDPIESTVVEAQHLSSSTGDADVPTIPSQSERVVFPTGEAAAVATGSTPEDDPTSCQDAKRASAEAPLCPAAVGNGRWAMSEKIRPQHLERKAILYVRQSSPYQVTHNLESQKLQYAMEARLRQLGWHEIEVVDEDLGRSAAGCVTRAGFERMVAEVCLGKVGAVAAREVSRFARNSREWQQLVEVCRVVDTVLIDQEMVYAPRFSNDRLLLGLKGSLNEYELDLLRQRSVEARREKARRGELIVSAPVGYIKGEDQRLEKDPDLRVQQAILLVFRKFSELGTVRQTLMWFLEHGLEVPTRTPRGETRWKRPVYRSMHRMLTSPAYGGAYTYGKTEHLTGYEGAKPRHLCRRKPREQWLALIPGTHEGYVSWEEFERIVCAIRENTQGEQQPGAVKNGQALLSGLLRCSRCGRKLTVRYTGNGHDVLRYSCIRGWLDNGEPRCIAFGGITVDEAIGREVLRVVQPAAIEASMLAQQERARQRDDILEALERDLQAARYAAKRAQRQYDAADPENRLVTAELERRWNLTLQHVREIELRIEQHGAATDPGRATCKEDFQQLAHKLEAIWVDPATNARLKKRIVRTLIEEVLVDVDGSAGELILTLRWKGGVHT